MDSTNATRRLTNIEYMKAKCIQKNGGIFYRDFPDEWANRDIINIPKQMPAQIGNSNELLNNPPNISDSYGVFMHEGWIRVGDEVLKVLKEH